MMKKTNTRPFHQDMFQESLQSNPCHICHELKPSQAIMGVPMNTHRYYFRIWIKCYRREVWVLWLMIIGLKHIMLLPKSLHLLSPSLTRLIS